MKKAPIVPIILAAGGSPRLPFPKPLAVFGATTAISIAVRNCRGLAAPIVVLGDDARLIRPAVPASARVILNQRWRDGQLRSLLCALRHVPKNGAFLLYPVDHPLLDSRVIRLLVRKFRQRRTHEKIIAPRHRGELGHPVIVSMELADEFRTAKTARGVIYRDAKRVSIVNVRSSAIFVDFSDPESYAACVRAYRGRKRGKRGASAGNR